MNEKEFGELAAGHALHALSPADQAAFEAARRQHPEWEHHVTADAETAALLADDVVDVAPPAALRDALLAQISGGASSAAEPAASRADRRVVEPQKKVKQGFRARSWFALAASLALLVGVGWGAVFVGERLNTPASIVALNQIESAPDAESETVTLSDGGKATAHWSASVGKAVLVSDGLPEIAPDQTFELWFVRDGAAIPAGTFMSDDGTATALLDGSLESGDVIAVTVEPSGGSPTGQPTSDPIFAIETA